MALPAVLSAEFDSQRLWGGVEVARKYDGGGAVQEIFYFIGLTVPSGAIN